MATPVVDAPLLGSKFDEDVTIPANNAAATVQKLYNAYHGYREVLVSTAATAEMSIALAPRCVALYFYDASLTTYHDLLGGANGLIDRSTAGSSGIRFDSATTADQILIASRRPFRGVWIEIEAANGETAAAAVRYSNTSNAWAAASNESDGTASAGASLAVDGNLTWDLPTDWGAVPLGVLQSNLSAPLASAPLYWAEIKFDGALGSNVSIDAFGLLADVAPSSTGINLKVSTEYTFDIDDDVGGLEMEATSTTATEADITWLKR